MGNFPETLSQAMLVGCNVSRRIGRTSFGCNLRRQTDNDVGDDHGRSNSNNDNTTTNNDKDFPPTLALEPKWRRGHPTRGLRYCRVKALPNQPSLTQNSCRSSLNDSKLLGTYMTH